MSADSEYQAKRRKAARAKGYCGTCYIRRTIDGQYRCPSCGIDAARRAKQWWRDHHPSRVLARQS